MNYHIYCDESSTVKRKYMLIGGLWLPSQIEREIRNSLLDVKNNYGIQHELKWTKVSKTYFDIYRDFVNVFFDFQDLVFKCIIIDTSILDYQNYHNGDKELGFYKFYFFLISRNLIPNSKHYLFTDSIDNREPNRLSDLKRIINNWYKKNCDPDWAPLINIEPKDSKKDELIQLVDILLGAVAFSWNQDGTSQGKTLLVKQITSNLGLNTKTLHFVTPKRFQKFNIWKWNPDNH